METHQRHTQPRGVRLEHVLHGEVQDLLDQLAKGLVSGDGDAIAALWETPAFVLGADEVHEIRSRDAIARFFREAKGQYDARGITGTRADLLDLERVGNRIVIATVRWPLLDAKGREVASESLDYTLRRDDAGQLRIRYMMVRDS